MEETENRDTESREQHPQDNQSRGDASPDGGASDGRPRGRRRRRSRRGRGRGGAPGAIQVAGAPAEGGETQGPAIREIPVTREAAQERREPREHREPHGQREGGERREPGAPRDTAGHRESGGHRDRGERDPGGHRDRGPRDRGERRRRDLHDDERRPRPPGLSLDPEMPNPDREPEIPLDRLDRDAVRVIARLRSVGHKAYFVGGCVRDVLLGRTPKDFDVATSAHPGEVRATFRNCRLIGRRFRLAHVYFRGGKVIEVATFRKNPVDAAEDLPEGDLLITRDNVF
ncbi:MAG TPA: hypothetical protein VFM45_12350, partial [Anaeromyxobacteraceae bacterium]|nr:hypothetical protein [Anaeromyxobacteraceae bacterium]